jgi:hypothetical protein
MKPYVAQWIDPVPLPAPCLPLADNCGTIDDGP